MVYASTGEPRGAEPPRGGEQNPTGAEPTDRGGRTESDSRGGGNRPARGGSEEAAIQNNIPEKKEVTSYDPRTMPDDEKARRGDMLRNAIAIEVAPEQIVATKELSARKAAEQWWDENVPEPAFYDTEIGEVEINKNSIESSLAHKYGQMKLDAITSLIEGFENAVYLGTMPDFARQEGVNNQFFAYPIMYNGKRCYVFCRAMEDANKNRLYVHEVFVSDKIKKGDTLQTAASQPHGGITLYRDILANVLLSGGKITNSASNKQENGAKSSEISEQKGEGREADGEKLEADKDVEGLSWGEDVVSHDNYGRETVHRTMYLDGKPIGTYYGKESGSPLRDGREEYAISVPGLETKQDLMLPLLDADGKDIRDGATGEGARYRLDAGWISFGSKEEAVEFYRRNRETIEKFNESADTEMSHEMRTMAESLVRDKELMKYANGVAFSKPGEESGDATAMGAELGKRIRERLLEMKPGMSTSELMKIGAEFLNEVFSVTNPATKGKEAHPGMVMPFYDALTGREETKGVESREPKAEGRVSDGEKDMLRRKWETMKSKMPEGTVFIVEHNGRYYAFGDDATRVNAALNGKGDEARTDFITLDEKQYEEALEVLDLKGFSVASYSAKDIKEAEQPISELPAKLQPIVRRLLELKSEMDRLNEIYNKSKPNSKEGDEAYKKSKDLNNEASEFIESLSMLSLEELNKIYDALGGEDAYFEWDFAKLFEKKEREKREQENLANAREAVKRSMEADLPEVKTGKPKLNIYNYTDKSASRPALRCVYHDKGYAVASDTHIVVASKEDYDAEHEGQLVTKEGDVLDTKFPNWRSVLNPDPKAMENPMPLDCDALLGFIASVEAKLKADKMKPKEIADTWQLVRLTNGDIVQVKLSTLKQFAIAAKQFGAKEIACNGKDKIYASTEKGSVVMTCNPVDEYDYYDYDKVGKTTYGFDMGDKYQRGRAKEHKATDESGELTPEEKVLVEGLVGLLNDAVGIETTADAEVGQRVLDNMPADSDVKTEAYEGSVSEFFHDASRGIVNGKPTSIGILTEEGRRFLESISGLSMKDIVDFVLNPSDCRHIINGHYGENEKDTGNNIPLNDRDLNNLLQVLSSPDKVVYGVERKSGRKMFFFLKDDGNGAYNLAEVYADRHGHLTTKTFYKTKKSSTQREHELLNNPSLSTSKTDGASSFDGAKVPKLFETQKIKYHKVYHGSGAEFEAFDFSHMGEGEGNQAYGWGGYVTEVEGIGRTYAKAMAQSSDKRTRLLWECKKKQADLQDLKRWHANAKEELAERVNYLEEVKQSSSDANKIKNNEYAVKLQQGIVDDYKQRLTEAETAYNEAVRALNEYDKNNPEATSILYTVEVPDDNGENYIDYTGRLTKGQYKKISNKLVQEGWKREVWDVISTFEKDGKKIVLNKLVTGADIYERLKVAFNSDRRASEFLNSIGFVGMSYPAQYNTGGRTDKARNFVIFNEGDMRITEKARFFRTSKGEVYGFTVGGKIYIDPRIATAETPIHEYAHLWAEALRTGNPKEWRNVVELMKGCKELWEKVKEDYPELKTDDEIAEEVLSHFSGRRGAERLRQEQRRMMDKAKGVFEKAEVASLFGRIKDALGRFWRKVANMLHIHYTSAEEVADRVLYDLLRGFNPKDAAKTGSEGVRYQIVGEKGAEAMDRAEEATIRLDNLRVAREMEKSRKDAKAIRMATGWERGGDGKWRYEVPDVGLDKLDPSGNLLFKERNRDYRRYVELRDKILDDYEVVSPEEKKEFKDLSDIFYSPNYTKFDNNYKLGAYLDAAEIYKAYPELKDFPIKPTELKGDTDARVVYEIDTNEPLRMEISKELFKPGNERKLLSTLLHEIQHLIQFKEGFAQGGGLGMFPNSKEHKYANLPGKEIFNMRAGAEFARQELSKYNSIEELKDYYNSNRRILPDHERVALVSVINAVSAGYSVEEAISSLEKEYKQAVDDIKWNSTSKDSPYNKYTRLGGEVEARNVQSRMNMSEEERRNTLLSETEDVAREDQLFLAETFGESASYADASKALENAEESDIVKRAKADGTYMKAPNGKPSKLNERQWEQVRSNEFKNWFGDWEKAARAKAIKGLSPIAIKPHSMQKEELYSIYKELKSVSKDGHSISFYNSAFKKNFKENGLFAQIVPQLREIFENSIFAYEEEDMLGGIIRDDGTMHKEHKNIVRYQNYVGKVKIDGKDYYVRYTVQEEKSGLKGTHSFFVSNVDIYENPTENRTIPITSRGTTEFDGIADAKLQQFFELSNNSSQVVDENGEPRIVYHGTKRQFWAFDGGKTKGVFDDGLNYFSLDRDFSERWINRDDERQRSPEDNAKLEEARQLSMQHKRETIKPIIEKYGPSRYTEAPEYRELEKEWEQWERDNLRLDGMTLKEAKYDYGKRLLECYISAKKIYNPKEKYETEGRQMLIDLGIINPNETGREKAMTDLYASNGSYLYYERKAVVDELKRRGYDGILITEDVSSDASKNLRTLAVWDPTKIKSATDNVGTFDAENPDIRFREVEDEGVLTEFAEGKTIKAYRTMQVIDGELYSPMATKVGGKETPVIKLGVPEQSEEHPELIKGKTIGRDGSEYGLIVIDKGQGKGTLTVAFNPYMHASRTALNDQFTSAHARPNLVTVEVEIPVSELTSGYRANMAKDAVGEMSWHSGTVSGQLSALGKPRRVILSRYDRPVRIVPYREVAEMIAKQLEGTDIEIPYNVVQPQVRAELERLGVRISEKASGTVGDEADFGKAEYVTDQQIERINARQKEMAQTSHEAKSAHAERLSQKLNTKVRIVNDVNEITHRNAEMQERMRKSKGWFDPSTGEVVIVLPNNRNVEDVAATVFHEVVAHKGLREMVGEENYDAFCDEIYKHLNKKLKQQIDEETTRRFMNDPKTEHEKHRRVAIDEMFGRLSEKGFEDFTREERSIWMKLRTKVLEAINKFLGSLKLPKWVTLGDNELRYMLWRSHERLTGKSNYVDMARDVAKRNELGLANDVIFKMGDKPETFEERQRRAVEQRGVVMPGLNSAKVKVVEVPRHGFTGRGIDAINKARTWAEGNLVGAHTANQVGNRFEYGIDNDAIKKFLSSSSTLNSDNLGVHLAVLTKLTEIIDESIEVEEHPDYRKNAGQRSAENGISDNNLLVHRMYGAVNIDGTIYRVKTTMHERSTGANAPHDYRVTKIELFVSGSPTSNARNSSTIGGQASSIEVAKLLKGIEKSYDKGKKILDESKKADESGILFRDGEEKKERKKDETEDIWQDQSLGFEERLTNAKIRLSEFQRDDKTLRNELHPITRPTFWGAVH